MELLGRPPPAYGLKFLVKAGSPDPVMTRHLWPALVVPAPSVAAGAVELPRRTETPTRPAIERMRVGRRLRRIGCPFSPRSGRLNGSAGYRKRFRNRYQDRRPKVKQSRIK